ncbi:MAG: nucleotidyltransferase family protein [Nitrosomonadales bacterium]|jgi:MurNAc alpha-1-phosphate uridylyltransferase|nr:nucleotidyltransferase family protein [Nitrosomonadales bacterium]MBT4759667.1 nucleotidyltransferase family protein [Nitrosomonadales bacterium]MBT6602591.1 nucleotidyltransferase family protein [Nitrosomonadales bacterium]MBT7120348.1 nucleotidyltransferase family protein [Nitrosomonadales bacterium]MBT7689984.1 nucleotidyltransferase family protein [Nitrosomonadales bacterium]
MKAMILAAGRGLRMGSLTQNSPKPLIKVKGKSLIEWHLNKLSEAGFRDVVVNVSYLSDKIIEFIGDGSKWKLNITISEEIEALETAGGIKKALKYLGAEPFVVINADIYSAYNYKNLEIKTLENKSMGYLVLVNNPNHNPEGDFGLLRNGCLTMRANSLLTFSGIAIYDPKLFSELTEGSKMKLSPILENAINKNYIKGELFDGEWSDIGTPERLNIINSKN